MPLIPPQHRNKAAAAALATAIAVPCEGLRQWAYYDPPNVLTVCAGHTGADVVKNRKYSLDECKAFLTTDMTKAINIVDTCAPGLPDEVLAAFADATFNIGSTVACNKKASSAARYLAAGKLIAACNELPKWDKARVAGVLVALPGLTKRRVREHEMCLQGAKA